MATGSVRPSLDAQRRLVDAAKELLTEIRPADITVRAIASRAGVQHSLITRHFGSRQALLAVAVADVFTELGAAIDAAPDLEAAVTTCVDQFRSRPSLTTSISVFIAVGDMPSTSRYPVVDALDRQLRTAGFDPSVAREAALAVTVMISGWAAAEPWWLRMSGHLDTPDEGRKVLERAVWALISDARGRPAVD